MFDYTPEGVQAYQNDAALKRLFTIDKTLRKIDKKLGFITIVGIGYLLYVNKAKIQEKFAKGE